MWWWKLRMLNPDQGDPGNNPAGDPPAAPKKTEGEPPAEPPKKTEGEPPETDERRKIAQDEAISERKKRQALEAEVAKMKEEQEARDKKLMAVLGGKDPDADPEAAAKNAAAERDAAIAKAKMSLIRSEIVAEASKLNVIDPGDVYRLADTNGIEVDLETGKCEGVAELVAAIVEARPYLVKKAAPAAPPGGGSPPASDPNTQQGKIEELKSLYEKAKKGDRVAVQEVAKRLREFREAGININDL